MRSASSIPARNARRFKSNTRGDLPHLSRKACFRFSSSTSGTNPSKAPKKEDIETLDTYSTVFLARRQFETVIISAYPTYQDYKEDKMNKIRYLKENNLILYSPLIGKYMLEGMTVIKDFDFAPISNKILSNNKT